MALIRELRYTLRLLLRSPGAVAVAVIALGLGIGVNLSSFMTVQALILHPFPFPHLGRVMTIWDTRAANPGNTDALAPANYLDWARQVASFRATAAFRQWDASLTGSGNAIRVPAAAITSDFFRVLGVTPLTGHSLAVYSPDASVAVVDDRLANEHLGGVAAATGKTIRVDGRTLTVVGVISSHWSYPLMTQVWMPLATSGAETGRREGHDWQVIGLLKNGVSLQSAQAESSRIAADLSRRFPLANTGYGFTVIPIAKYANEVTDRFVLMLLIAATFVWLLAAANVANVQMARAVVREKEIALRAAIGANSWHIARQLILETIVIACIGAVVAIVLAGWSLDWAKAHIPERAFYFAAGLRDMKMDSETVLYTCALALVTGVLASLPAVLQLLRQRERGDLNRALQTGNRTASVSLGRNRMQNWLVGYEVAMALVLLIGATFMVKTFNSLLTGNYGYDPRNLLQLELALPSDKYSNATAESAFYGRALDRLSALPNAESAAVWSEGPDVPVAIEGRPAPTASDPLSEVEPVSASFLHTMSMPLVSGRFFDRRDGKDSQPVAVVSAAVARRYWGHQDPVGSRVRLTPGGPWVTIIGVAGDLVRNWLANEPEHLIYVPYTQSPLASATLLVRTHTDPALTLESAQAAMRQVDPDLAVYNVETMQRHFELEASGVRAAADSMARYAVVALLLAATGIFGVLSYFVSQRTHDIGVRMALGADASGVVRLTIARALRPVFAGGAVGLVLAYVLSRAMASALYGIVKLDVPTFAAAAAALVLTALLASYLPARRATRIDPLIALRDS